LISGLILWNLPLRPAYAATFDVDRTDDNAGATACTAAANDCSLRGAIIAAGTSAGPDTINLPAGTYTLSGSALILDSEITLQGAGAASTIIQADASPTAALYRVMIVTTSGVVTLSGVTVRHGGGGTALNGGGIYNSGELLITNGTIVSNNRAVFGEGGGRGGGIYNDSTGQLWVVNGAAVSNNTATIAGGGIYNGNFLDLQLATIAANTASSGGGLYDITGDVTINLSSFDGNTAPNDYGGGAILTENGTMYISYTSFSNNQGYEGGAIRAGIEGNPMLVISSSTFSGNIASGEFSSGGGAILLLGGGAMIYNSTFSGNSTTTSGGGIFVRFGSLTLLSDTITNNTADSDNSGDGDGGGLFLDSNSDMGNTILAGNTDLSGGGPDCASAQGTLNSLDYNLIGNTTGCTIGGNTANNITGANPLLGALQNNGGPTSTHLPQAGSPAIDAGDNAACAATPINNLDQRGEPRPIDGDGNGTAVCDIGSVEVAFVPVEDPTLSINGVSVTEGDTGTVAAVFTVTRGGPLDQTSTVDYATADDTATVTGADYAAASGTLTFAPEETSQQITVLVNGDTLDEGISEQFVVNLSNPANAIIQQGQGIGTIVDDDGPVVTPGGPSPEDIARSQAPLCSLIGGGTNPIIRAQVQDSTVTDGSVFCRIIAQQSEYVTGPEEVGNADLLNLGVIQAVDVFGLKHNGDAEPHFNYAVKACLLGTGRLFYLDATTHPRALSQLPTTSEFGYTCALIANAGTVVLVP
jgi:hypothetical protein